MSMEAKLDQPLTNHSLRAYSVTKTFKASMPEKIIMERSGHRSMEGVRNYERTSTAQELQVYQALSTRQPSEKNKCVLPPPKPPLVSHQQIPMFSGCSFNNCTIQMAPPISTPVCQEDFSHINIEELLDF